MSPVRTILCALLVGAAPSGLLFAGSLLPNQTYQAGEQPTSIVTADFNGDGRADIAVANAHSDDLSVLAGRGDGTFGRPRQYPAGPGAQFVVSADFDANGTADLAVVHRAGVTLFLGRGDGMFDPLAPFDTGTNPTSAAEGDFNHDGLPDLLVANAGQPGCDSETCTCAGASIAVLLNRGGVRFTQRDIVIGGTDCAAEILTGDFNQDGEADIVLTQTQYGNPSRENLAFLPGRGDGSFGPGTRPTHFEIGTFAASGDFDEDGNRDLVVESLSPSWAWQLQILRGTGDGRFTPGAAYPSPPYVSDIAAGDLDGDGHLDLIVSGDDEVFQFHGHGDGTLTPLGGVSAGRYLAQLALGDFNGDHRRDVAVVSRLHSLGVAILLGQESGAPGTPDIVLPQGAGLRAMISGDFNQDSRPDLAVINENSRTVSILAGLGDGTFRLASAAPTGFSPYALTAGDLNGDGNLDLAVANLGSDDISILVGSGTGGLFPISRPHAGRAPRGLAIGRFNADSFPDLVVANQGSNDISILPGLGFGAFGPQTRLPVRVDPFSAATGDFDGNGLDDIAVANYLGCNCVSLFRGRGDGSFAILGEPPAGDRPTSVTATDLDGDGHLDLIATNDGGSDDGKVSLLAGRGDGSFGAPRQFDVGDQPMSLAVSDFNGDGLPDLATANRAANDVSVLLGTGPGRFARAMRFGVGREPWSIAAADFNSDGRPDLAVLDSISSDIRVLLNQGPGNHAPTADFRVGGSLECTSPRGSTVELDASASTDTDSTPDTNDDIQAFQWYEDYDTASQRYLGPGERLEATLPVGSHPITLVATDSSGAVTLSSRIVQVTDTTPPRLAVRLNRTILWPPDHRLVDILAEVTADDACGEPSVVLLSVRDDEAGELLESAGPSRLADIQGADLGTFDLRFRLRAERYGSGEGRIYSVTYQATDRLGNVSTVDSFVRVPASVASPDPSGPRGRFLLR